MQNKSFIPYIDGDLYNIHNIWYLKFILQQPLDIFLYIDYYHINNCTITHNTVITHQTVEYLEKELVMFVIDTMSRMPVYEQIIKQVEELVMIGAMKAGDKMPSVRQISVSLSINPNTVQKAYTELDRRGIIITVPGKGSFISETALQILGESSRSRLEELSKLIRELAYAGVTKEEIVRIVEDIFKK